MTKNTKIILFSSIVILLLGIVFFPKYKGIFISGETQTTTEGKPSQQNRRQLNVNAMILKPQKLTDIFRTKGQLLPDEEVDLSFESSGKITNIYFKEGTSVKKGTLLAKVNDQPLLAELKKLEAQIPLAQERVNRQRTLLDKDAVSQEAYQAVTTDMDKLMADIDLVKARIRQTELRAPFDGIIGLRWVSEGAFASTGTVVARLTKISPLKIEFSVNERHANNIRPGTRIGFVVEGDETVYTALVYAIETTLDEKTLSLKARALYENPGGRLRPGRSASIEIVLREINNAIVVPSISTIAEMGRDLAFVYKNGKARQIEIRKGLRTASSVQIIQGLQSGDTLLTTGVMQLRDGLDVIISNFVENEAE